MFLTESALQIITDAEALLITAGAGMGVDSGLPDFRGNEGFWKAYPPMQKLGLSFAEMADPRWFFHDPTLAWGFYGHRLNLYRSVTPHSGFTLLRKTVERLSGNGFVVTSNVDGQFQQSGFEAASVYEIHGSIHHLQCVRPCTPEIWSAQGLKIEVDPTSFRATSELPCCMRCGALARPNILMFGDPNWVSTQADHQRATFQNWLDSVRNKRLAIVECGAGTEIASIRNISERTARISGSRLIRINPRDYHVPIGQVGIPLGALDGLSRVLHES